MNTNITCRKEMQLRVTKLDNERQNVTVNKKMEWCDN
jgi:hypothetical protein